MRRYTLWIAVIAAALSVAALLTAAQDEDTPNMADFLPITEDVLYEVGVGDTLDDIAATFDLDLTCLRQINDIADNVNTIFPGDQLVISVTCPPYAGLNYVPFPRPFEQGGADGLYTVRVGDTLSDIALAFDISEISLAEFNGIENANEIFVGQVLEIPPGAPPFGQVPPLDGQVLEQGGAEGDVIYTIQPLDTLDTIGAFYNADPDCIAETNGIANANRITPRTTILVSQTCAPYTGPNTAGGRILPITGAPTAAPTTVITVTPRNTLEVTNTPAPIVVGTPTPEVITEVLEDLGAGGGDEEGDAVATPTATTEDTGAAAQPTLDLAATTDALATTFAQVTATFAARDTATEEPEATIAVTAAGGPLAEEPTPTPEAEMSDSDTMDDMASEADETSIIDVLGSLFVESSADDLMEEAPVPTPTAEAIEPEATEET
ncbi:MAG: LysM peptidoglycan-binding domain-containing protein [Chloroflexota bacterium]